MLFRTSKIARGKKLFEKRIHDRGRSQPTMKVHNAENTEPCVRSEPPHVGEFLEGGPGETSLLKEVSPGRLSDKSPFPRTPIRKNF